MLSRRHLRIRVMQALYAYYQSDTKDMVRTEQELLNGTKKIFELYLLIMKMFVEMAEQEEMYYADTPASAVTGIRKSANRLLKENVFIAWLEKSSPFLKNVRDNKISWQGDHDVVKKAFFQLRQTDQYKTYSSSESTTVKQDIELINWLFQEIFTRQEFVVSLLEERNIYWAESMIMMESMISKTLDSGKNSGEFKLLPLYKDEEDDVKFMRELVKQTIKEDAYFTQIIGEKTQNWDADRIAIVDIILMKMALSEILYQSSIPIKVSINEYIDISKDYSTPNSKSFINGVIDKLVIELKEQGKIQKVGRGLLE